QNTQKRAWSTLPHISLLFFCVFCVFSWLVSGFFAAARPRLDVEQAEDLFLREAQGRRRPILLDQFVEEVPFPFQDFRDPIFNGVLHQEAVDKNRVLLANAMGTIDGLVLDRRIPPAIEQEYVIGALQIQADATGTVAHEYHMEVGVRTEAFQDMVSFA